MSKSGYVDTVGPTFMWSLHSGENRVHRELLGSNISYSIVVMSTTARLIERSLSFCKTDSGERRHS